MLHTKDRLTERPNKFPRISPQHFSIVRPPKSQNRFEVGDSGDWTSGNRAHYTVWTQDHHPAEDTTDGSDYVLLDGQESTTCGGFNGFHDKHYASGSRYSVMNDVDSTDAHGCWWMQAIPLQVYTSGGYLEGYNGTNLHVWQSFWVR